MDLNEVIEKIKKDLDNNTNKVCLLYTSDAADE